MQFTKAHGCGNDFIITELQRADQPSVKELRAAAPWLCDRHRGVGADGVLVVTEPDDDPEGSAARAQMSVINADGSIAEMCGNGLRCVGHYLHKRGRLRSGERILTGAGALKLWFAEPPAELSERERCEHERGGAWVGVDMGQPREIRSLVSSGVELCALSLGNPHAVSFDAEAFERRGALSEELKRPFVGGVNLSFARWLAPGHLELHVDERGCGWTQACGTGACATVVAAVSSGQANKGDELLVRLPGGTLKVSWLSSGELKMWGPAIELYSAHIQL